MKKILTQVPSMLFYVDVRQVDKAPLSLILGGVDDCHQQ